MTPTLVFKITTVIFPVLNYIRSTSITAVTVLNSVINIRNSYDITTVTAGATIDFKTPNEKYDFRSDKKLQTIMLFGNQKHQINEKGGESNRHHLCQTN